MTSRASSRNLPALFRFLLVAGLPATAAYAQVQIAENLLIDLNATTYTTAARLGRMPGH
jgi:hypothetical protein